MMKLKPFITLISAFSLLSLTSSYSAAQAQPNEAIAPQRVTDCTNLTLDGRGDEELTKEERIRKLEGTLYDSVDRYDTCVGQAIAAGGGGGAGGGGSGEGSGSGSGQSGARGDQGEAPETPIDTTAESQEQPEPESTGSIPEDIPSADNDSVLQRQIRDLATKEKDPQKRKELWDLYRKYKT
jgi:hypothetical protein